jgi:hypothetical protein
VNRIEDRLRDAFAAAAETVQPESLAGLPEPSHMTKRRHVAALAAAAAVAVVVVGASVIAPLALGGDHRAPSAPGGAAVPSPSPSVSPNGASTSAISVPAVVGASVAQAEALLSGAGLHVTVRALPNATDAPGTVTEQVPAGTVMEQIPAGGTFVASGAAVTVLVAVGSGSSATITLPPPRLVTIAQFAVTIAIEQLWQPAGCSGWCTVSPSYSGVDGFVDVSPLLEPLGLHAACTRIASSSPYFVDSSGQLHPMARTYGSHPQITYRSIDGQPGCLIVPSGDAPVWRQLYGGPALRDSSLLVEYRKPLRAPAGNYLNILQISTDPGHLQQIADSVQLHH